MQALSEQSICCPYCGEVIRVLVDASEGQQRYIEDCQVCCQPIEFQLTLDMDGDLNVQVFREDEAL